MKSALEHNDIGTSGGLTRQPHGSLDGFTAGVGEKQ
ncbi:Uncharacterised protein [Mycobacteroides abscessus subsp. abscessus]|nr:Uncharacterised protein [Mycobacteroides abscessus subsp. abscessus]